MAHFRRRNPGPVKVTFGSGRNKKTVICCAARRRRLPRRKRARTGKTLAKHYGFVSKGGKLYRKSGPATNPGGANPS